MTGRERFLTAIRNEKPDRLPCQVHNFMPYYLNTYLHGMNQFEAYEFFDMDPVIYDCPSIIYDDKDTAKWIQNRKWYDSSDEGVHDYVETFETPKGTLTAKGSANQFTSWETEHMIKTEEDFELFKEFFPVAIGADWSNIIAHKKRIGDRGIVRTWGTSYGQPGSWQSLCYLIGIEEAIMKSFDSPEWVHYALNVITEKALKQIENMGKIEADIIENGGGSASSTVISPTMHREFCLPYDKRIHEAMKAQGAYVTYHLCGGLMPLLEIVAENGADCLETMTPASMGGDAVLSEATRRVGDKLAFIGGFDQNAGFERGTPEVVAEQVARLHAACPNGGYICSPSDHFFFGNPENIKAFAQACKNCRY